MSNELEKELGEFFKKWIPNHYGHLIDNDENDGERLRQSIDRDISNAKEKENKRIRAGVVKAMDKFVFNMVEATRFVAMGSGEKSQAIFTVLDPLIAKHLNSLGGELKGVIDNE